MKRIQQKVYFRADAGSEIGYGHYIRSLALADMLKSFFDCVMFTQEPTLYQIKEAKDICQIVSLPADERKFGIFVDLLTGDELVVLDNYFFTTDYQRQIKEKGCKLVCIDDMHDKYFVADMVINHGFAKVDDYNISLKTKLCIGPKYALLRRPFLQVEHGKKRRKNSWIVCFGGVDSLNLTGQAVQAILSADSNAKVTAVVGEKYQYKDEFAGTENVIVCSSLTAQEMADLFSLTERVVCAASSVCYEAMACGCKVYAGWYVDNQIFFYEGLKENRYIIPLGDLRKGIVISNYLKTNILILKNNALCGLFVSLALKRIPYTEMDENQSRQVWECRNIYEIRQYMTHPEPFSFDNHCRFIMHLKEEKARMYYAYFLGDEFVASYDIVGIDADMTERGLFVNPRYQRLGIGEYVEHDMQNFAKELKLHILKAKVLKDNETSYYFHLHMGYKMVCEDDRYYYLEYKI